VEPLIDNSDLTPPTRERPRLDSISYLKTVLTIYIKVVMAILQVIFAAEDAEVRGKRMRLRPLRPLRLDIPACYIDSFEEWAL
jgi:hypothetical protein